MLGLPRRTELNKRLNKTDIYKMFNLDNKQQELFDADISLVYIVNEISKYSLGISKGENIFSIHVLRVVMKTKDYDSTNITKLFKLIDNKIVLALEYGDEVQIVVHHTKLFKSEWQPIGDAKLEIKGLNLDVVYENFITQIGNFSIEQGHSLDEQIAADEQKTKLEKEIARLEKKARNEKQPKKKFELVQLIKKLRNEV